MPYSEECALPIRRQEEITPGVCFVLKCENLDLNIFIIVTEIAGSLKSLQYPADSLPPLIRLRLHPLP